MEKINIFECHCQTEVGVDDVFNLIDGKYKSKVNYYTMVSLQIMTM